MAKITREEALAYHASEPKGKVSVVPTKPAATQRDLSLAYTPGVAEPCLEIEKDPDLAYEYTAKGNLVAVITNGTAVLGLGDIGALAGKPVMEGKGVLFKRFADIDVFDIELDTARPGGDHPRLSSCSSRPSAASTSRTSRLPSASRSRRRCRSTMNIPVFHDDQHGTAIISGAALLNAVELVGKKIDEVKLVFSGAGAAAIACVRLYCALGRQAREPASCATPRASSTRAAPSDIEPLQGASSRPRPTSRTLADALVGADVFVGLSAAGVVTPEMVEDDGARTRSSSPWPTPTPEIGYDEAMAARPDVDHGHRPQRLPQPGQQRARLPLHLPRRPRRAGDRRSTTR